MKILFQGLSLTLIATTVVSTLMKILSLTRSLTLMATATAANKNSLRRLMPMVKEQDRGW
jgi:hypothetical protein